MPLTVLYPEPFPNCPSPKLGKVYTNNGGEISKSLTSNCVYWRWEFVEVSNITEFAKYINTLANKNCIIIHGIPKFDIEIITRRMHKKDNPDYGDIIDVETNWMLLDFDNIILPKNIQYEDIKTHADFCLQYCPPEFRDTAYYARYSSSAGTQGWDKVSLHIYFILKTPITCETMKGWGNLFSDDCRFRSNDNYKPDLTVFNSVQAHFISSPGFYGMKDPIEKRSVLVTNKTNSELTLPYYEPKVISDRHSLTSALKPTGTFVEKLKQVIDNIGVEGSHYHTHFGAILWAITFCHGHAIIPNKGYILELVSNALIGKNHGHQCKNIESEWERAYSMAIPLKSKEVAMIDNLRYKSERIIKNADNLMSVYQKKKAELAECSAHTLHT